MGDSTAVETVELCARIMTANFGLAINQTDLQGHGRAGVKMTSEGVEGTDARLDTGILMIRIGTRYFSLSEVEPPLVLHPTQAPEKLRWTSTSALEGLIEFADTDLDETFQEAFVRLDVFCMVVSLDNPPSRIKSYLQDLTT